jgi:hypothetical protein
MRSVLLVDTAIVSDAGLYKPELSSPLNINEGADALPVESILTSEELARRELFT